MEVNKNIKIQFPNDDSNKVYDGKVVNLFVDEVLTPNGNIATREIIRHNGGVCVLAIIDDKIILERQYRYAYDEILYELPAGKLEKNEDPKQAGIRELLEETGYEASDLIDYGMMYPTCGYSDEIIYLYKATSLTKKQRHLDEDEVIDIELVEINKVVEMINNGLIKDAKSICLILKYLLNKQHFKWSVVFVVK